jgi:hypothetical protein
VQSQLVDQAAGGGVDTDTNLPERHARASVVRTGETAGILAPGKPTLLFWAQCGGMAPIAFLRSGRSRGG